MAECVVGNILPIVVTSIYGCFYWIKEYIKYDYINIGLFPMYGEIHSICMPIMIVYTPMSLYSFNELFKNMNKKDREKAF